jgi:hypothetical protein
MRLHRPNYHDIERIIEFDFVRATEAAALNSLRWLGRGEKEKADEAACDAMRARPSFGQLKNFHIMLSSWRPCQNHRVPISSPS